VTTLLAPSAVIWSIIPVMLKPDALEGHHTRIPGPSAADFAAHLAAAIDSRPEPCVVPLVPTSRAAAERARVHVTNEIAALDWYLPQIRDVPNCQRRLDELRAEWQNASSLAVADVIIASCVALGFTVTLSRSVTLTEADYAVVYRDTDPSPTDDERRRYLIGRPTTLLLLCGRQENSALQMMKTYLRYVCRYPTENARVENWVHVTNPNASNYPELLMMFAERQPCDQLDRQTVPDARDGRARRGENRGDNNDIRRALATG
jgi:hypothetical protein